MRNKILSLATGSLLLFAGCEETLLAPEYKNTAVDNFECLWTNYDLYYGQFQVRNINWDSLYTVYRPRVDAQTTDRELYQVFKGLLQHFHDDHVFLDPTVAGLPRMESGRSDTMKVQTDFSPRVVEQHYLLSHRQYSEHIWWGMLPGNIGYIRMDAIVDPMDFLHKAFDELLGELKGTKGMVFDIRRLEGGEDRLARYIAGRFADGEHLYMTSRKRNGPKHDDFEPAVRWVVCPEGTSQYTRPVVLLTGRFTASAGETFTWAMNELSHVTQAGDTTLGAFSDIMVKELPNGWLHTIAVGDYRNASGENLEGKGIEPQHYAKSSKAETLAGIDRGLDKALELLGDEGFSSRNP